ncbi:hypothetical protein LDC_1624 [sediment metagenome]|uniref:Uncharacterized protein n=1 Tax=sediment metagenome TaxID=749907 RepID=D9PJB5_9ZZZZ
MEKENNRANFEEKWRQLVIERVNAGMSPNLKLSIGMNTSLTKDEVIEHVKKGDEIGLQIINLHRNFMKAQASGQFTRVLNTV